MYQNLHLEIASKMGEPINTQLPVPVELREICDVDTAEPGEHVWRIQNLDETADVVLAVDSNGAITVKKRTPLNDVEVTFSDLNSKLEYVLVMDVLSKVDTKALGRRKASITRGMDKRELQLILNAILAGGSSYFPANETTPYEVSVDSGDDLYDVIMEAKHGIEDYGTDYVLLAGSTVKEKIDTYNKRKASSLNYNVDLPAELVRLDIKVMKIFGQVSVDSTDTEAETALLHTNKFIMIARNSRIADGKPISFVRRKINADIAKMMGADVDKAQRALIVNPTPVNVSGTNTLAFGIYGVESIVFCIKNPKAIATCDCTSVFA